MSVTAVGVFCTLALRVREIASWGLMLQVVMPLPFVVPQEAGSVPVSAVDGEYVRATVRPEIGLEKASRAVIVAVTEPPAVAELAERVNEDVPGSTVELGLTLYAKVPEGAPAL